MTVLVVGASGATGQLLVRQLLDRGLDVRAIVRSPEALPDDLRTYRGLSLIQAAILDLGEGDLVRHVSGCSALASCLGHNLNFRGIYGQPRRLVSDATRRLCDAIKANGSERAVKFVLMNTAGNSNRDIPERVSLPQQCVIQILRLLLPPHADNEKAADYLRTRVGQNDAAIEWAAVRPDTLTDESEVSEYEVFPSPVRSALFNSGRTSRVNVAHFMAQLITDEDTWNAWRGKMPVIYNREPS